MKLGGRPVYRCKDSFLAFVLMADPLAIDSNQEF
jgi:hypothetical protein